MVTPIKSWGIRVGNKTITLLIINRLPWIDECQRVCSVLVGLPEIFFATTLASKLNGSGHNDKNKPEEDPSYLYAAHLHFGDLESLVHWCYGKQMVLIKAHFLMFGQCRFDVNSKVLGTWIRTVWQHELYHVTSQLHCVCQCIATDHSREKMQKLCCLGRPTTRPCVVDASCVCLWDFHGWRHRAGLHRK